MSEEYPKVFRTPSERTLDVFCTSSLFEFSQFRAERNYLSPSYVTVRFHTKVRISTRKRKR